MSIHEMWLQATKPVGALLISVVALDTSIDAEPNEAPNALPEASTAASHLVGCRETPQKKSTPFANTRVLTWRADRPRNR